MLTPVTMNHAEMVRAAAKRLKKRYTELEKRAAERRVRAQEFARALAPGIAAADPDVVRIIGFGSTFETWRPYRMDSDIDLGITDAIEQLRAELRQDLDFIRHNYAKNREMTARVQQSPTEDEFEYAALGYTLHNLYNAFESYFYRVAKFFENQLDETEWHRSLVDRMSLKVEGIRPALFDRDLAERINELRGFRHLFRTLYKTPLIPAKVRFANDVAEGIADSFVARHDDFDQFLREVRAELK